MKDYPTVVREVNAGVVGEPMVRFWTRRSGAWPGPAPFVTEARGRGGRRGGWS